VGKFLDVLTVHRSSGSLKQSPLGRCAHPRKATPGTAHVLLTGPLW
jgi:hypothetical protein